MNHNLMLHFGEHLLTEQGVPFDKVIRVDFNLSGSRGYSELTPECSDYPVLVRYVRDDEDLKFRYVYDGLYQIINILEDIDDKIRESWYE